MLMRVLGGLLVVVSVTQASVTAHQFLSTATSARLAHLSDRLVPLDAENDLRASGETSFDASVSEQQLRAALSKNPWDTRSWISLSVLAESSGDTASAERDLRAAAAHNIGREPRWALANFYFRQGERQQFLATVNGYRSVTHDHEDGLFRMVAELVPDSHGLAEALPLLQCDEMGTAIEVYRERQEMADELVNTMARSCRDRTSSGTLGNLVNELLLQDQTTRAEQVWHEMGGAATLTNANFEQAVTGQGFDWRINQSDIAARQQKQGLEFTFPDGSTDGTVLLFQPVILSPGVKYRLSMNVDVPPPASNGFRWELVELSTGQHLDSGLDDENINEHTTWEFKAPAQIRRSLALALYYRRPNGGLPFSGRVVVSGVQLAPRLNG